MYVEQFWKCFEQSGDINTYLGLKEYEKLYHEHTVTTTAQENQDDEKDDLDRMS